MLREPCIALTIKILALGRPLSEAERLAAVITVWVVLLRAMMGYAIPREGAPQQACDDVGRPGSTPVQGGIVAIICGILPAPAGTAGGPVRTLLHC
jgi:hypothetical protein